jgi:hypothetical protein
MTKRSSAVRYGAAILLAGVATLACRAQDLASSSLPDAPDATMTTPGQGAKAGPPGGQPVAPAGHQDPQTKRILGIIPNFRSVSANEHLPPQTTGEKLKTAMQDSFDYSSVVLPAAVAGYGLGMNSTPEFGGGGIGYGRYFWHSFVDQANENLFVEFIVPAPLHEDTRYYTLGKGGGSRWKRAGYAASRVVITRSDKGTDTFNAGEVVGAGISAAVANLYYPSPERTFSQTGQRWGQSVGIDAVTFAFKEFWPDINHFFFHGKTDMAN